MDVFLLHAHNIFQQGSIVYCKICITNAACTFKRHNPTVEKKIEILLHLFQHTFEQAHVIFQAMYSNQGLRVFSKKDEVLHKTSKMTAVHVSYLARKASLTANETSIRISSGSETWTGHTESSGVTDNAQANQTYFKNKRPLFFASHIIHDITFCSR